MKTELFKFIRGTDTWTLTNAKESIVYETETYTPAVISTGQRESVAELNKSSLAVYIDLDEDIAQNILTYFGEDTIILTMFITINSSTQTAWKGKVVNLKPSNNQIELEVNSIFSALQRTGIRAKYQKLCRHALYRTGCNVTASSFETACSVTGVSTTTLTVPDAALQEDGYYSGGMITMTSNNYSRWVVYHSGSTLVLVRDFESLKEEFDELGSVSVKIYPGCDHTRQTCVNKFNNVENYGGFPWIPSINPVDGKGNLGSSITSTRGALATWIETAFCKSYCQ